MDGCACAPLADEGCLLRLLTFFLGRMRCTIKSIGRLMTGSGLVRVATAVDDDDCALLLTFACEAASLTRGETSSSPHHGVWVEACLVAT